MVELDFIIYLPTFENIQTFRSQGNRIIAMKNATLLHNISEEQFTNMFQELQKQIQELHQKFEPKKPVELLTRKEVTMLLHCDLSTLHNWCKKGKLIPYGIGNRVYYKRSDIEAALVKLR